MNYPRWLSRLLSALLLSLATPLALAGKPQMGMALADRIQQDLGMAKTDLVESGDCRYGRAADDIFVTNLYDCFFVATADNLLVLYWSEGAARLLVAMTVPLSSVKQAAYTSSFLSKQLQMRGAHGWLVLAAAGLKGSGKQIEALYGRLGTLGVPQVNDRKPVDAAFVPAAGTIYIPIYIPR